MKTSMSANSVVEMGIHGGSKADKVWKGAFGGEWERARM